MNYRYYRDLKHNYLVVKNEKDNKGKDDYQLKLLEGGRLTGLLPCNIRNINGEQFLYYEIGDLQNLRDRYTSRGMNRAQQLQLFSDMKDMLDCLSEYLLGEDAVVFDIDSIFIDLFTGKHSFMFCPFASGEGSFERLAEELLEITRSDDDEAATAIYELCEYASGKGAMTMEAISRLLKSSKPQVTETPQPTPEPEEEKSFYEEESSFEEEEDTEEEEDNGIGFIKKKLYGNNGIRKSEKKLSARLQLLFSGLFAALVGGMVYVRMEFILTKQENYMSMAIMAVALVCGALCLVGGIKGLSDKNEAVREDKEDDEDEEEFCMEENIGCPDGSFGYGYEDETDTAAFNTPLRITSSGSSEGFRDNRTVVLNMDDEKDAVLNLYSRNLDKTMRIGLDKLPLTIGKMEGCVDRVLSDMSVSRIHCRIFKDEDSGRIALMDLNSTNGTFKNGLRLQPREKNFIDEGDEVRIGRICFDCR